VHSYEGSDRADFVYVSCFS